MVSGIKNYVSPREPKPQGKAMIENGEAERLWVNCVLFDVVLEAIVTRFMHFFLIYLLIRSKDADYESTRYPIKERIHQENVLLMIDFLNGIHWAL